MTCDKHIRRYAVVWMRSRDGVRARCGTGYARVGDRGGGEKTAWDKKENVPCANRVCVALEGLEGRVVMVLREYVEGIVSH